jgi:6-phosphogluconolactonase
MANIQVVVHANANILATAVADRLITRIAEAQAARGMASIVLTGGGIGIATLRAIAASTARDAVDWRKLHIWWGDERFTPEVSPDRNVQQAREALLQVVPIAQEMVHPMPASDTVHYRESTLDGTPEAAATAYIEELAQHARPGRELPTFDVLMLGIGPEGHIASIFPESPAVYDDQFVTAVHGSPKPPPTRLTMTFPTIRSADEVWLLAAGPEKTTAVGLSLSGSGPTQIPAAGARGVMRTMYFLDRPAAALVPPTLRTPY